MALSVAFVVVFFFGAIVMATILGKDNDNK